MLRPIPVALASCTRFFEAMSAMRESFATLQKLRMGRSANSLPSTPARSHSQSATGDSDCVTPPPWRNDSSFDELANKSTKRQEVEQQEGDGFSEATELDISNHRRLSWPPVKTTG